MIGVNAAHYREGASRAQMKMAAGWQCWWCQILGPCQSGPGSKPQESTANDHLRWMAVIGLARWDMEGPQPLPGITGDLWLVGVLGRRAGAGVRGLGKGRMCG